jgi:hypothetical protein
MKKTYIIPFIGLVLAKLAIDYSYGQIVSVLFAYQNYKNDPSVLSITLSWVFLLSLSPLIVKTFMDETLSSSILSILILMSLVPTITLIQFNSGYAFKYVALMYIYWALLLSINYYIPTIVVYKGAQFSSAKFNKFLTVLFCTCVLFVSWKYTGFRFHFGLVDVYDLRTEAREYQVSTVLGYIITAADNILPVLMVYYLIQKRRLVAMFIILISLLNFGISAVKQVVFLLIIALSGYFFVKSAKLNKYYVWGVLFLFLLSIGEFNIFSTYFITNFSSYRIFFLPAKLHYVYYDFFSLRELDYFRQSAFKWFLDSPYKDNIQFIMGDYDIGDFTARANNGLFTDAYLNFGAIGVLFFPVILVIILKVLEGSAKGLDPRILFIITTSVSFVLLSIPFTTALLSSGIFLLIIFLYSLPRIDGRGRLKKSQFCCLGKGLG